MKNSLSRPGKSPFFWWIVAALFMAISAPGAAAEDKSLIAGVREDCPPFSYGVRGPDQFQGFSVDLCRRIANARHQKIEFKPLKAAERFKALKDGRVDILCEATTVTIKRIEEFQSSLYTFISGASLMYSQRVINKEGEDPVAVGYLNGTTTEQQIRNIIERQRDVDIDDLGKVKYFGVDSHLDGLRRLLGVEQQATEEKGGYIDIYVADREILLSLKSMGEENFKQRLVVSGSYYTIEPYALFTKKDHFELMYDANRTLSNLYKSDIGSIFSKNFPRKRMSESLQFLYRFQQLMLGDNPLADGEETGSSGG
jgi:polar amino acid transport system substrate-binding protein/glutamate/aspartate transport system substrate-binding protein